MLPVAAVLCLICKSFTFAVNAMIYESSIAAPQHMSASINILQSLCQLAILQSNMLLSVVIDHCNLPA